MHINMVEFEASTEETDELGYNYVKIRPGDDGRIYAFSEEFNNEFNLDNIDWDPTHHNFKMTSWPAICKDEEAWKEEQRKTARNIEELQMRLNLQIEKQKERLWSDDKLDPISLIDPYYEPEPKGEYTAKALIYKLFNDCPRMMAFDPSAIMFKS